MDDKRYLITWDGYSASTGVGMGDGGGYPERQERTVDSIGAMWYMLRDHPERRASMRFYALSKLDGDMCFDLMREAQARDEAKEKMRELKAAQARVEELKEG